MIYLNGEEHEILKSFKNIVIKKSSGNNKVSNEPHTDTIIDRKSTLNLPVTSQLIPKS